MHSCKNSLSYLVQAKTMTWIKSSTSNVNLSRRFVVVQPCRTKMFCAHYFIVNEKMILRHDEMSYDVNIFFVFVENIRFCDTLKTAEEFFQHVLDADKVRSFNDFPATWCAVSTSEIFHKNIKRNETISIQTLFDEASCARQKIIYKPLANRCLGLFRHQSLTPFTISRIFFDSLNISMWTNFCVAEFHFFHDGRLLRIRSPPQCDSVHLCSPCESFSWWKIEFVNH